MTTISYPEKMWFRAHVTVGDLSWTVTATDALTELPFMVDGLSFGWNMADDYPSQLEHTATIRLAAADHVAYGAVDIGQPVAITVDTGDVTTVPDVTSEYWPGDPDPHPRLIVHPPGEFHPADVGSTITGHPGFQDGTIITAVTPSGWFGFGPNDPRYRWDRIDLDRDELLSEAPGTVTLTPANRATPGDPADALWSFHGRVGAVTVTPRRATAGGLFYTLTCAGYYADLGELDVRDSRPQELVNERVREVMAAAGQPTEIFAPALLDEENPPEILALDLGEKKESLLRVLDDTMWQTLYQTDGMPGYNPYDDPDDNGYPLTDRRHSYYGNTYPFRVLMPYATPEGPGRADGVMWSTEPIYPRHFPTHMAPPPAMLRYYRWTDETDTEHRYVRMEWSPDTRRGVLDACHVLLDTTWQRTKAPPTRVRWDYWNDASTVDPEPRRAWHNLSGTPPTYRQDRESELVEGGSDLSMVPWLGATFTTADPFDGWETGTVTLLTDLLPAQYLPQLMPNAANHSPAEDPSRLAWLSRPIVIKGIRATSHPEGRTYMAGRLTSVVATIERGRLTAELTLNRSIPRPFDNYGPGWFDLEEYASIDSVADSFPPAIDDVDPSITITDLRLVDSPNNWNDHFHYSESEPT